MKRLYILLLACVFTFTLNAQMPDGTVVPDFTTVDLDGNSHNLYEYLDQGKTVIIDVYAVWCGPCWDYHQTHALADAYNLLGPEGSDNLVVMGIEGDASTSVSSIWTGAGNSIGDWTEGIPYIMADDASVANLLEIAYYPTVYKICPGDKTIYEIGQLSASAIASEIFDIDCMPPANSIDVGFAGIADSPELCPGESTDLSVEVINVGSSTVQQYSVKVYNPAGDLVAQGPFVGNHYTYQNKTVNLGTYTATGNDELTYVIDLGNDENDTNNTRIKAINSAPTAEGSVVNLELKTDFYGFETYWEIQDENGNAIASGGNEVVGPDGGGNNVASSSDPTAYDNNEVYNIQVELPSSDLACYNFLIVDDNNDGICCGDGSGYYELTDNSGNVILSGGQFEMEFTDRFGAGAPVATKDVELVNTLSVFPNPVVDQLTIAFEMEKTNDMEISIVNMLGQQVHSLGMNTYAAGEQVVDIDVNNLESGIYFVSLQNESGISTRKFTVSK